MLQHAVGKRNRFFLISTLIYMSCGSITYASDDPTSRRDAFARVWTELSDLKENDPGVIRQKITNLFSGVATASLAGEIDAFQSVMRDHIARTKTLDPSLHQIVANVLNDIGGVSSRAEPPSRVTAISLSPHTILLSPSDVIAAGDEPTPEGFFKWAATIDHSDDNHTMILRELRDLMARLKMIPGRIAYLHGEFWDMNDGVTNALLGSYIENMLKDSERRNVSDGSESPPVPTMRAPKSPRFQWLTEKGGFSTQNNFFSRVMNQIKKLKNDDSVTKNVQDIIHSASKNPWFDAIAFDTYCTRPATKRRLSGSHHKRHRDALSECMTRLSGQQKAVTIFQDKVSLRKKRVAFDHLRDLKDASDVDKETKQKLQAKLGLVNGVLKNIGSPKELIHHLSTVIMGQEDAKSQIALAVWNHYKMLQHNTLQSLKGLDGSKDDYLEVIVGAPPVCNTGVSGLSGSAAGGGKSASDPDVFPSSGVEESKIGDDEEDEDDEEVFVSIQPKKLKKQSALMIGPSGTGKTRMMELIAEKAGVPVSFNDATQFTSSGYVGGKASDAIKNLLREAKGNIPLAEIGIVFVDEIDKTRRAPITNASGRDIIGRVQSELLRLMEGDDVTIKSSNPAAPDILVNTGDAMFVFAGAFAELTMPVAEASGNYDMTLLDRALRHHDIAQRFPHFDRLSVRPKALDITAESIEDDFKVKETPISTDDLFAYGMKRELLGRIGYIIRLHALTPEVMKKILLESHDSILAQKIEIFKMNGLKLSIRRSGLSTIVDLALDSNSGARGLTQILAPLDTLVLDEDVKEAGEFALTRTTVEALNHDLLRRRAERHAKKEGFRLMADELMALEKEDLERRKARAEGRRYADAQNARYTEAFKEMDARPSFYHS